MNPVPGSESGGDGLAGATRRIRSLALVLSRLCDALTSESTSKPHDTEFWVALGQVMRDIAAAAAEAEASAAAMRSSALEVVHSNGDGPPALNAATSSQRAADLARDACEVDVGQIIENNQDSWDALIEAVRCEKFPHDGHALCNEEHLELYSKVITTLPAELRSDFRRLTMSRTVAEIVERHAAFELGRQIERRDRTPFR